MINAEFALSIREDVAKSANTFKKCWMKESLRYFRIEMLMLMMMKSM